MDVVIYGDFNCPYSYLASQRADRLTSDRAARIDWRAVEHDRGLPLAGIASAAAGVAWDDELAEIRELARPGELVPQAPPPVTSNTAAAVAAYAEVVADGAQDEVRRRLFAAIWADGENVSSAYAVRRLVTGVLWAAAPLDQRLASPELPGILDQDGDLTRITRRSGGLIAPDGGPLSTQAFRRIAQWRREWLAIGQVTPLVIGADGIARPGVDGLRYLGELLDLSPGAIVPGPRPEGQAAARASEAAIASATTAQAARASHAS